MFIGLDRKRFEATLIDRASPRRMMAGMRALRVGDGDPPQHFREFSILSRPEEEVSVIRHCLFILLVPECRQEEECSCWMSRLVGNLRP